MGWRYPICACLLLASALFSLSCSDHSAGYILPTLSGTVTYEDKEYAPTGLTGVTRMKPVRHALVEVVAEIDGKVLGTGRTDKLGDYAIMINAPYRSIAYVRVLADTSGLSNVPSVTVKDSPGGGIQAAAGADTIINSSQITADVSISAAGGAGGAFNILDVMTAAGEFAFSLESAMPPHLPVYWHAGSSDGTYFAIPGGIHVLGTVSDTDEYDDDVLWHEYGHFIMDVFSIDNSPAGGHDFTLTDMDLRLSWSEGYSDYFQASMKRWLIMSPELTEVLSTASGMPPTYYVDTTSGPPRNSLDIAAPGPEYIYSSNEIAVAKVLLDLEDPYGLASVWDIINSIGSYLLPQEEVTLESFWDGWVDTQGASVLANSVLTDRKVFYLEDTYEAEIDDEANPLRLLAVNGAAEEHYLFSTLSLWDTDHIAFNATSPGDYIVETSCMKNGADTILEVLDTDGATLINGPSDDDFTIGSCPQDQFTKYSSSVVATISTPGIYYAVVNTSTGAKPIAPPNFPYPGRYGTYSIKVTGP